MTCDVNFRRSRES